MRKRLRPIALGCALLVGAVLPVSAASDGADCCHNTRPVTNRHAFASHIGSSGDDEFNSVDITADNCGYIAVGNTSGKSLDKSISWGVYGKRDALIVKYDQYNKLVAAKTFGGTGNESFNDVEATADGGCIIVGYSESKFDGVGNNGKQDGFIMKLDANGNVQWARNAGSKADDTYTDVTLTSDGGYITGGRTAGTSSAPAWSYSGGYYDSIITKYDRTGQVVWTVKSPYLNKAVKEEVYGVTGTSDGGAVAVGKIENQYGQSDGFIVRYDAAGKVRWTEKLALGVGTFEGVITDSDGGFVAVGAAASGGKYWNRVSSYYGGFIMKYDANGKKLWHHYLNGKKNIIFNELDRTASGYVVGGYTDGANSPYWGQPAGDDAVIMEYDRSGRMTSAEAYTGNKNDYFRGLAATGSHMVAVGYSNSTTNTVWGATYGGNDALVVRFGEIQ